MGVLSNPPMGGSIGVSSRSRVSDFRVMHRGSLFFNCFLIVCTLETLLGVARMGCYCPKLRVYVRNYESMSEITTVIHRNLFFIILLCTGG